MCPHGPWLLGIVCVMLGLLAPRAMGQDVAAGNKTDRDHKTVFRYSIRRERLEELTFVGSDAAGVRFYSTLTGDDRAPGKTIRSRKILIVTKRAGAWKVGWGQNTRLADSTSE